jgi:hypothetical protein
LQGETVCPRRDERHVGLSGRDYSLLLFQLIHFLHQRLYLLLQVLDFVARLLRRRAMGKNLNPAQNN